MNLINAAAGKSKVKTKMAVSNKNDWPKLPQAPSMMMSSKFNNMNNNAPNSMGNEMNFKMDQLLGTCIPKELSTIQNQKLNCEISTFLEAVQTQTCQISELKNEVMELQRKQDTDAQKYDIFTKNIEFRLSKLIEEYLIRFEHEHNKRLEAFVVARYIEILIFFYF